MLKEQFHQGKFSLTYKFLLLSLNYGLRYVPDPSLDNGSSDKTSGGNGGKVRIVQFSEETALSRSIRRKTTSAKLDGKD